jgi:hypothetical protein
MHIGRERAKVFSGLVFLVLLRSFLYFQQEVFPFVFFVPFVVIELRPHHSAVPLSFRKAISPYSTILPTDLWEVGERNKQIVPESGRLPPSSTLHKVNQCVILFLKSLLKMKYNDRVNSKNGPGSVSDPGSMFQCGRCGTIDSSAVFQGAKACEIVKCC